jgi:hypothetical protein
MYKPSTYLVITYLPTCLPIYETYITAELVTKVKPNINSVEVHPRLSYKGHPEDGVLVGACSLWPQGLRRELGLKLANTCCNLHPLTIN